MAGRYGIPVKEESESGYGTGAENITGSGKEVGRGVRTDGPGSGAGVRRFVCDDDVPGSDVLSVRLWNFYKNSKFWQMPQ